MIHLLTFLVKYLGTDKGMLRNAFRAELNLRSTNPLKRSLAFLPIFGFMENTQNLKAFYIGIHTCRLVKVPMKNKTIAMTTRNSIGIVLSVSDSRNVATLK